MSELFGREATDSQLVTAMFVRRLVSSVAALEASLLRYRRWLELRAQGDLHGAAALSIAVSELPPLQRSLFTPAKEQSAILEADIDRVDHVLELLHSVGTEDKVERLRRQLEARPVPTLIFVDAVATALMLRSHLSAFTDVSVVTARQGRDKWGRRSEALLELERFTRGGCDVIICTDVGSEGLNLQRAAHVIHYDLPWNAVRLRQRVGRSARLGAVHERVHVTYFVPRGALLRRHLTIIRRKARLERKLFASSEHPAQHQTILTATPLLGSASPQARLAEKLREEGRLDVEFAALLTRRYPAGHERVLTEMIGEKLNEQKLVDLKALLRGFVSRSARALKHQPARFIDAR